MSLLKMRDAQCPLIFDTAAQTSQLMKFQDENIIKEISQKRIVEFQRFSGAGTLVL